MKRVLFYSLILFIVPFFMAGKVAPGNKDIRLTQEELKLYNLVMAYRAQNGLPAIPLSISLTEVALTHVMDLEINRPDSLGCTLHSWSEKGKWQSCCYTPDNAQKLCMWNKPKELTDYQGNGFEIAATKSDFIDAKDALALWKASQPHNNVILNKGVYNRKWNAIGIGIYKRYSVIWFGYEVDKGGKSGKP